MSASLRERDADLSIYPGPVVLWLIRLAGGLATGLAIWKKVVK